MADEYVKEVSNASGRAAEPSSSERVSHCRSIFEKRLRIGLAHAYPTMSTFGLL
jgi:hypothetical protein